MTITIARLQQRRDKLNSVRQAHMQVPARVRVPEFISIWLPPEKPPVSVAGRGEAFTALVGCDGLTGRIVTPTLLPRPLHGIIPTWDKSRLTRQVRSDLGRGVENTFPPATNPASSANARRHVLPKDLPNAVKHLNDEELDRLLAVTLAEAKRRGRQTTPTDQPSPNRKVEAAGVIDTRATECRACGFQGWHHTRAHCSAVRFIPIGRADGAEV